MDVGPGALEVPGEALLGFDIGIKGDGEHAAEVGGRGTAHTWDAFDAAFKFLGTGLTGISFQPECALVDLRLHAGDVLAEKIPYLAVTEFRGVEIHLHPGMSGITLHMQDSLVFAQLRIGGFHRLAASGHIPARCNRKAQTQ